jgi:hypothetical protein
MWRKAKEREEIEEKELVEANMIQVKGRGKRRAAEKKANLDRGLNEARGFTPGLMRVREPLHRSNQNWGAARGESSSGKRGVRKKAASQTRRSKAR